MALLHYCNNSAVPMAIINHYFSLTTPKQMAISTLLNNSAIPMATIIITILRQNKWQLLFSL